ncbi:DNL zinc finger-domain-containing protein [Lipomyces orientalis]|uniref:DNL zinc finger-domain-containing protein n=1 Tax=Lipomyces orientalis TaxID=1233043 RepID=A0ACC3TQ72_9ASCO
MWKLRASAITRGLLELQPNIVSGQIRSVGGNPARCRLQSRPFSAAAVSRNSSQRSRSSATQAPAHTHTHVNGEVCGHDHSHSHSQSVAHNDPSYRELARAKIPIDRPTYNITLTCKVCKNRSSHFMSHQAYHHGTVLVKCPGCNNRHLIADHLKIFSDTRITLEDIIAKDGAVIRKGTIAEYRGEITELTEPIIVHDDAKNE